MRYLVIKNNKVINAIVWNGTDTYDPGPGVRLQADPDSQYDIGDTVEEGA